MNENDRLNLQFLLNCSEEVFRDWYLSVDDDDHKYANSLMTIASWEMIDLIMDTSIAENYLRKYRT